MHNDQSVPESALFHCPFLGLVDDSETPMSFPSAWNNCHYCTPVAPVLLDHQRDFCLSLAHSTCPVLEQSPDQALPDNILNPQKVYPGKRKSRKLIISSIILGLLAILGMLFITQMQPAQIQVEQRKGTTSQPILKALSTTQPITPTLVLEKTTASPIPPLSDPPLAVESAPETPTFTFTRVPHQIESLIGVRYIFKIHRLQQEETLSWLAYKYGTTQAAIIAVNYNLPNPLRAKELIIIPVNQSDTSGLPKFEAYRVKENTTLEALAAQLDVKPTQLQLYNGFGANTQLFEGEWLVIPREAAHSD